MFARQPFATSEEMHKAADEVWWSLTPEDWLEAFAAHPMIGERSTACWSAQEQSGMSVAAENTARELERLNAEYAERFGFIFIICATGKSADEMLEALRMRLKNSYGDELRIAAAEQAKITHLRLDKL
jgi:OHCU decarboxylase